MQRRQLLKALLPLALLPAGIALARPWWAAWGGKPACELPDLPVLLDWLKPLADIELGSQVTIDPPQGWHLVLQGACRDTLVEFWRQRAVADFVANRTIRVDGWVLSETEAFTHRAVFLASAAPVGAPTPSR